MKIKLFIFLLMLNSHCFSQDNEFVALHLTRSGVFLGNLKIADSVDISFITQAIGSPNRIIPNKNISYIYDSLGVIFWVDSISHRVNIVSYYFENPLLNGSFYPQKKYNGNIYVDNLTINKHDTENTLLAKCWDFEIEGGGGFFIITSGNISFCVATGPLFDDPIIEISYWFNK